MTTSRESLTLISALLQVHQITDRSALLPVLLHALAAEHGPVAALAYLPESGGEHLQLALTAAAGVSASRDDWEAHGVPDTARDGAAYALQRQGDQARPAGSLEDATCQLWEAGTAERVEQALGVRLAAMAPVRSAFAPWGAVVLLFLGDCPADVAAGAAAHAAAALGRLLDREIEQDQEGGLIVSAEIDGIAAREVSRAQRYGRVLSLSLLERTDGDTPGPLLTLAAGMMRRPDTAGLLEDGRIVALLPETPPEGAASFLRRLYERTTAEGFTLRGGSASYPDDGASFSALLARAGERLRALEPAALAEATPPEEYVPATAPQAGAGRGLATVGIRIAPITDSEIAGWRALLQRLPSVVTADACGFDGMSGTFNVTAPSVTRLLVDLQGVAAKMDARLSPTITGEVSISLRAADARPREMRAVAGGSVRALHEPIHPRPAASDGLSSVTAVAVAPDAPASDAAEVAPPRRVPAPPPPIPPMPPQAPARRRRGGPRLNLNRPGLALLIAIPVALLAIIGVARLTRDDTPAASTFVPSPPAAPATTEPAGSPVATLAPPVATGAAQRVLARDLTGGCLPEPGKAACDDLRAGLWAGDMQAWQRWLQSLGQPAPTQRDVFERVFAMRVAVNDPAARQDVARATNAPLPIIAGVTVTDRLMAVELLNFGVAPANLAGAILPGGLGTVSAGASLAPDARCVASTVAEKHTCPFGISGGQPAPVGSGTPLRLTAADGRELDVWVMP